MKKMMFIDKVSFSKDGEKNAISARDGVQEYLGVEIGLEPLDKTFTLYRSPETIRAINEKLVGIPVTDNHIELEDIPQDDIIGVINSSEVVVNNDKKLKSSIAIKNGIKLADNMLHLLNVKDELSLGYFADTVDSDLYDFEQVNIVPHHLAIVESGRCGDVCKFKDERKDMTKEEQAKLDEEAKKQAEIKDAEEKAEAEAKAKEEQEVKDAEAKKLADEEADKKAKETEDAKETKDAEEEEAKAKAEAEKKTNFADSKEFKDAVKIVAGLRVDTILKARNFLDSKYDYSQDSLVIMRDALATQCNTKFADEEVGVAFKMLKKFKDYSNFADEKAVNKFDAIKDKEI